ncbi:hypothetical protein COV82_01575 [Candidatus Peregrinibacteria bacterium CG11_big_fil_rev_8_21_14_0_20_46_8]|nr:MAG: hypothetical protein COV82_01575 [Candidatus Peregrinibacteria bacterium CG11_big_fil_rev_8_21_14_0_20_46_8]
MPNKPGVYKMLDAEGRVIYVGKAKDIKKRVQQYFQKNYQHSTRTKKLLSQLHEIQWIETDSELEAFIFETNLIKELRPKYNILMKDDKSYVYIVINLEEDYPRIRLIRAHTFHKFYKQKRGLRIFGPKLASTKVYESLRLVKKLFPFRHCNLDIEYVKPKEAPNDDALRMEPQRDLVKVTNKVIEYPCLDLSIKRCPGPCVGGITPEAYKKIIQQVIDFLSGKTEDIEKNLKEEMQRAAQARLFEKAARIRDKLFAVQNLSEKQKVEDPERVDTDVINFVLDGPHAFFNLFMVREGKLINQENFIVDLPVESVEEAELVEAFLTQYYERAADIPKEILVPCQPSDNDTLLSWLEKERGTKVRLIIPQRGSKNKLLDLSQKNATWFSKQQQIKWMAKEQEKQAAVRLAKILELKDVELKRIEGFDISHIGGEETVASMVVFEKGLPKSKDYRYLRMRTVGKKPDDYKSMEEALVRRLKYLSKLSDVIIKTPNKKQYEEIVKIWTAEKGGFLDEERKQFMVALRDDKIVGFARLFEVGPKISVIASLWVAPEERGQRLGYEIMRKLIKRSKLKRVYIDTEKELEEYYAEFGFLHLKKVPQPLLDRIKRINEAIAKSKKKMKKFEAIHMSYDVTKHKADTSFSARPDLIVVDGGKGQVTSALNALKKLGLEIPVIGLAKRLEEIYQPGQAAPILLDEGDEALKLLQRIRDEAHRFANQYTRKAHVKTMLQS